MTKQRSELIYFKKHFVRSSYEDFECPDVDCKIKSKLAIICPVCKAAGRTEFFHEFAEAKNHFQNFYKDEELHRQWNPFKEMSKDQLAAILSITIKHDETNKVVTFLNCLNSQTENDQFTITNMGGSSEGKTWTALEVSDYFPQEKQIIISNASPTAFYHEHGVLCTEAVNEEGLTSYEPIQSRLDELFDRMDEIKPDDPKKKLTDEQRKELNKIRQEIADLKTNAVRLVDLEGKIIIFLDQANPKLMENLRSLISHDRKYIPLSITNRSARGSNYTEHIVLVGYPTMIFCTAYQKLNEQEITRTIQLSPDTDQNKLNETLKLIIEKKANDRVWYKKLEADIGRRSLMFRIELIEAYGIKTFISEKFSEKILSKFLSTRQKLQPRHQRDLPRIYDLIHGHALLNTFNRTVDMDDDKTLEIEAADVEAGFAIYEPVAEANEHYVSPEIWDLYENIIAPLYQAKPLYYSGTFTEKGVSSPGSGQRIGVSRSEIKQSYREKKGRPLSDWTLTHQIIPSLLDAGLIIDGKNPEDQRERLFTPIAETIAYTLDSISSPSQKLENEIESTMSDTDLSAVAKFLIRDTRVTEGLRYVSCKDHADGWFTLQQYKEHLMQEHHKQVSENGLRQGALDTFKQLSGDSKQPVEDKEFYNKMEKTGKFTMEQAEKVFQDMWKSGVIFEVRAHFFKKA